MGGLQQSCTRACNHCKSQTRIQTLAEYRLRAGQFATSDKIEHAQLASC
jgi:hypothetical protein